MNVIFLDIDGVMNSEIFYRKRHTTLKRRLYIRKNRFIAWFRKNILGKSSIISLRKLMDAPVNPKRETFKYQFDRLKRETCSEKWVLLSEFCNENDIKICISSVWKTHFMLSDENTDCVLDVRWEQALVKLGFNPNTYVGITGKRKTLRGEEIQEWLNNHPEVDNYAILDDDSDMLPEQMNNFYKCDGWYGLSPNHLYKIKRKFNKNKS